MISAEQSRLNRYVTTVVTAVRSETEHIRVVELADPDDWELPPFTAGAHIDLILTDELVRQYSLCGDPRERTRYRVAVLAVPHGRGGSLHMHRHVGVGSVMPVSLPRNMFPLASDGDRAVMIAGGIGLTPFMTMLPQALREGRRPHLHVCTRRRELTPFLPQLDAWRDEGLVTYHHDGGEPERNLDLAALLADVAPATHVYACGPAGLLDAFMAATAHWPRQQVHTERFGAGPLPQRAYTLELARSGRSVDVAAGETMAQALKRCGADVRTGCEAGICGICRVRYIAGDPDHQDRVLTAEERRSCLMPCVSGSLGATLILDL